MVQAMRPRALLAALLLCFCINLVAADRWGAHIQRRDGSTSPSITTISNTNTASPSSSASNSDGDSTSGNTFDKTSSTSPKATESTNSTATSTSSSTSALSTAPAITANILGPAATVTINNSTYNSTLTPDKLPITPQITPGFGIVGIILLISGAGYTVIGVKNKILHVFLSSAYLTGLSITVLILYVINLPVSNAIQGAYIVAVVMTGLILGAVSIIFTEITEGLGCLLGGFCISMWFLVLKPGGLLASTGAKSIFIACLTFAAFSTSFSRYTRLYGLIVFMSFAGATITVLGIDCFSRAGLKEFWAYLFALNLNLFPVGATSYPLTRGIRVEIAAIIIFFLCGIISQMKLWKLIKERREQQRAVEQPQGKRNLQKEEDNVGREIKDMNAEERNQWEAVYGDKGRTQKSSTQSQRDSGVGDLDSQRKSPISIVTSSRRSGDEDIELSDMPSPIVAAPTGLAMNSTQEKGPITVWVAGDLQPGPQNEHGNLIGSSQRQSRASTVDEDKIWVTDPDGEARLEKMPSRRQSKRQSNSSVSVRMSGAPEVVPLPFRVPEGEVEDDKSSVATFADEEQGASPSKNRKSLRVSAGSAMMRRLSKKSLLSPSPRSSKRLSYGEGPSTEDLVIPQNVDDDRASSVAATMDGLSDDEDDLRSIRSSIYQAPDTTEAAVLDVKRPFETEESKQSGEAEKNIDANTEAPVIQQSLTKSTDPKDTQEMEAAEELPEGFKTPKIARSAISALSSKPTTLSKDTLPPQVSRVVMSYRTNEWAKHLSNAEAPAFEELTIEEEPTVGTEQKDVEVAVAVNVEELQQTAENTAPTPSQSRANSVHSKTPKFPRQNVPEQEAVILSQQYLRLPSVNDRFQEPSSPAPPHHIVDPSTEQALSLNNAAASRLSSQNSPFGSANTLLSQRESMVRNKHSFNTKPVHASNIEISGKKSPPQAHEKYQNLQYKQQNQSIPTSRVASDASSVHKPQINIPTPLDDDSISLSARRNLIRQSSLQQIAAPISPPQPALPFDSHQPRRQPSTPSHAVRESQLASWRASVQHDLQNAQVPKKSIERQRSALWHERQAEEQRRALDARKKGERNRAFDEGMRRGDMLDAHREALRKMQASANKNI